ncbi:MAG: helix-turn-helix transcriptional regulator [Actinomycetota bacterium]|nr:helix-turn-helix transcriptional regulator [Actinomycetota bacterium]
MPEGQRFDEYVEEYRAATGEAELEMFDEYTDAFRLANQILKARKRIGLTQVELASRSGIGQSEISRIERGEGNPTVETLSSLGRSLELELQFVDAASVSSGGDGR